MYSVWWHIVLDRIQKKQQKDEINQIILNRHFKHLPEEEEENMSQSNKQEKVPQSLFFHSAPCWW